MQPSQGSRSTVKGAATSTSSIGFVYSIADLIVDVKDKFGDTFSEGAYTKACEEINNHGTAIGVSLDCFQESSNVRVFHWRQHCSLDAGELTVIGRIL